MLSLFCEEDLEVLCPDCVQPHDQQGHHVRSLKEAASYYRHKTNDSITHLREDLWKLQKAEEREDRKFQELKDQILKYKSKLDSGIENLNEFVDRQQEAALSRLAQEEKDLLQRIKINVTDFKDHICTTKAQLQEVSERCVMPDMKLLSEVKRIHHIYESREVPAVCFSQLRREVYHLPPLESALEKIQQKFRAEVTLDPHTADPHLCVSKDKRSGTLRKRWSKVLQREQRIPFDLEVLGSQEFHAGRHYWEVQVNDKSSWAIGLCSHSPSSRGQQQLMSGKNRRWFIHLQDGDYLAVGACPALLALAENPRRIGVYLDWELGQISFYNLSDNSHLHSFQETFSHSLKPYFCVAPDSIPLSLCAVRG